MANFKNFKASGSVFALCLLAGTVFGEPSSAPETPDAQRITLPQAVILGTIEGLTEYLPVSSTGHLILAADAMHLGGFAHGKNGEPVKGPLGPIMEPKPAVNAFNIVIQIGAIFAVVGIYFKRIVEMFQGLIGRNEKGRKLLINLIAAFMPSAVVGLLLAGPIEKYLFSPLTVAIALAVGGAVMIWMSKHYHRKEKHIGDVHDVTIRSALIIGLVQCLAMWPGTSRSMVTILTGLGVGLSMVASAEFSFLLALPTLTAATLYKTVSQWNALTTSVGFDSLILGIVISAVVAAISVRFLIHHLTRHGLAPFGVYRIALAIGVIYYFAH
jgi:undecaprenyl-diphosphatase